MEGTKSKWTPIVFDAQRKFKMSIFRAFRRGHVDMLGRPLSKRLFHNRKNTCKRNGSDSRYLNTLKKLAYADYRRKKAEGRI